LWRLEDATIRLDEVVEEALRDGLQVITAGGEKTAVVLSYSDYLPIRSRRHTVCELFRHSPLVGANLDLSRDPSPLRDDPSL